MREQGIVLEHHADAAQVGRLENDFLITEFDAAIIRADKPASTISNVVLPDPDGPRRVRNSPDVTSKLTFLSAWKSP